MLEFVFPFTMSMVGLLVISKHTIRLSGPSLPRMVVYSGEGAAKYFDKDEARKRVHRGGEHCMECNHA